MSSQMRTIERMITSNSDRIEELESELNYLKSLDLEAIIRSYEEELKEEKERNLYLRGLRAKVWGC